MHLYLSFCSKMDLVCRLSRPAQPSALHMYMHHSMGVHRITTAVGQLGNNLPGQTMEGVGGVVPTRTLCVISDPRQLLLCNTGSPCKAGGMSHVSRFAQGVLVTKLIMVLVVTWPSHSLTEFATVVHYQPIAAAATLALETHVSCC